MKAKRVKLIHLGEHQIVHLPKQFRFPASQAEALVSRDGRKIVLEPLSAWSDEFLACLGAWHEKIERPLRSRMGGVRRRNESRARLIRHGCPELRGSSYPARAREWVTECATKERRHPGIGIGA